ncbi:MAG: heat-inducible transcriptional repressor HrcA [Eubacterium sp.]|jgi:heat-inducible transcriptional repressor|nr:heat-inducible transcriptional repressor HrcA [Eubacterium sp.]
MERIYKVLDAIVDEYIRTGEPVGSKALQEKIDVKVSSATIRNDMASLEALGFLDHPHTSAGRIPTIRGYKLYIERIREKEAISTGEKEKIDEFFKGISDESDGAVIENASKALSEITKCAIVSTNMISKFSIITKVNIIPTGKRMYVLLLITSSGDIKNRVCRLSFDLTDDEMDFFIKFINQNLEGLNADNLSEEFIEKLTASLGSYMLSLSPLLKAVTELSLEMRKKQVLLEGETKLIASNELEKDEIIALIESKNQLTELLDAAFSGINVIFGKETDTFVVQNAGMITGGFQKDHKPAGSFGVIGPMRLDYKRIIPYIEYFSEKVTNILSSKAEEDPVTIEKEEKGIDEK